MSDLLEVSNKMVTPKEELEQLAEQSLLRVLKEVQSAQTDVVSIEGNNYVNFSSNDYLGLSAHPLVKEAFKRGIDEWGAGSGASRLISGSLSPHTLLEKRLAELKGKPACRLFSTGYATSIGLLSGLFGKDDVILLDKLCHASLIDGSRMCGATIRVFPHNDLVKLEKLLIKYQSYRDGNVLIVTESVFSMDGDTAPLSEIVNLKKKYKSLLLVDEAHALGVCGQMGLAHELGVSDGVDFHMGTLGKAAGVAGGYVACSQDYADLMVNRSRSFIYSTAPPPGQSVAALEAVELILSDTGKKIHAKLWSNINLFADIMGLATIPESAIIPWHVGESEEALTLSESLKDAGYIVPAVRFPTVPRGTARLRITLSASHSAEQIKGLCHLLKAAQ